MTERRTLLAGLATIAVANGVALGGVMYNRSEAESELALTEHEFRISGSTPRQESSELKLRLRWCGEPDPGDSTNAATGRYPIFECTRSTPRWLDKAKLASLGFDVRTVPVDSKRDADWWRQRRAVFLVMELDGPVRQRVIERAREALAAREADLARHPDSTGLEGNVIARRNSVAWLENGAPRLFVVDAGLDRDELRARYPDQRRYAIVRGWVGVFVRSSWRGKPMLPGDSAIVVGDIHRLEGEEINVAADFRDQIQQHVLTAYGREATRPHELEISVAFGRRLEPWIRQVAGRR
jgi:hypothetical protein